MNNRRGGRGRLAYALTALLVALSCLLLPAAAPSGRAPEAHADPLDSTPADPKPQLYRMLAYNSRIDTQNDELRMDFVLRLAHGQMDPGCVPVGRYDGSGKCGLSFVYAYWGVNDNPYWYFSRAKYLNTMGQDGAARWAANVDQYYTIHQVVNSGKYDYLTISLEGDVNYPDAAGSANYDGSDSERVDPRRVGGAKLNQFVYAIAGREHARWDKGIDTLTLRPSADFDYRYVTNIAEDYPAYVYTPDCVAGSVGGACNGPMSFVGWDGYPSLFSGGQSNWGMVADYGFRGRSAPGVAPPRSFFVYWYNPAYGRGYPCSRTTSFYYQWIGLKDGRYWQPVSSLTPTVQRVDGQHPVAPGTPPAYPSTWAAFNEAAKGGKTNNLLAAGAGGGASAQLADGSIDFEKAKRADGLDGYFKLVTWPVSTGADGRTSGCDTSVNKDAYNPDAGITAGMSQAQIAARLDSGWTIDTVMSRYQIPRPDPPVIGQVGQDGYSSSATVTVSGTSPVRHQAASGGNPERRYMVTLYAEDPRHPIRQNTAEQTNDYGSRGVRIGQAEVDDQGRWSVVDNDTEVDGQGNVDGSRRRYHAYLTEENSGDRLTSDFSNIVTVTFYTAADPTPSVDRVRPPRTVDGRLPSDAKGLISGSARITHDGSSLSVDAVPAADPSARPIPILTRSNLAAGRTDWQAELTGLGRFRPVSGDHRYVFRARLTTRTGKVSALGEHTDDMDMTPPKPGVVSAGRSGVRGVARSSDAPGAPVQAGGSVSVVWPDGSRSGPVPIGSDGTWSLPLPAGMTVEGLVGVRATDPVGNESAPEWVDLRQAPRQKAVPFTGGGPWSALAACLGVAALALAAAGAAVIAKERRDRHPVAAKAKKQ
ncbi:Ig-like domain-containing protein [Bifidobacterium xylocopae]|uniref:Uncharacterized protein n=1 Tax=Bifidobacterium xylocopae TaxID=2493119 RepID=A0A366KDI0_9BIFI|nr:hypothetical protein [Bifidobacterium xylocopae]RBP99238.1 hypothetical protein CRD59_05000 [Bifidobacterium xylocopae]